MNIAVIPARSGSKRIPRKNIKMFRGKPMIAWSIEVAKKSSLFDHIVVSTDDVEIANIAREYGAQTPFLRPMDLANATVPTVPVIAHAAKACEKLGLYAEFICCIYPCSPFTRAEELVEALRLLKEKNTNYVYPIVEYPHPVQRAMTMMDDGKMKFLNPESELIRTQDLKNTYHDAGQFYWGRTEAWKALKKMHTEGLGYIIPKWRVVDIDTLDDWRRAEYLFELLHKQSVSQ